MPVMDGYGATKAIKSRPKGKELPIIAVTASTYEGARDQVLAAGCDNLLRKPFREGQIFQMLEVHLGVEFIYEDIEPAPKEFSGLVFEQEIALPAKLRQNLLTALRYHDPEQIKSSITAIEPNYPNLAAQLRKLAKNFKYDQIIKLILSMESEG